MRPSHPEQRSRGHGALKPIRRLDRPAVILLLHLGRAHAIVKELFVLAPGDLVPLLRFGFFARLKALDPVGELGPIGNPRGVALPSPFVGWDDGLAALGPGRIGSAGVSLPRSCRVCFAAAGEAQVGADGERGLAGRVG